MNNIKSSLESVKKEIENYADELIYEGKMAFSQSRFEDANKLSNDGIKLQEFGKKINSLIDDWDRNFNKVLEFHQPKKITSSPKSTRTGLSVTFPNGNIVCETKASTTFMKILWIIGFERIITLGKTVRTLPLVSRHKNNHPIYVENQYQGYWIITHSSTKEKKETLEKISKELGLGLKVEIIN